MKAYFKMSKKYNFSLEPSIDKRSKSIWEWIFPAPNNHGAYMPVSWASYSPDSIPLKHEIIPQSGDRTTKAAATTKHWQTLCLSTLKHSSFIHHGDTAPTHPLLQSCGDLHARMAPNNLDSTRWWASRLSIGPGHPCWSAGTFRCTPPMASTSNDLSDSINLNTEWAVEPER